MGLYKYPSREARLAATFWSTLAHHVWLKFGAHAQPRGQSWDRLASSGWLFLPWGYCETYHNPSSPLPCHSVTILLIQEGSKEQANGLLRTVVLKL